MPSDADLAELVMDHLSRHANMTTAALASAIAGLASLLHAYDDAQNKRGNRAEMLTKLRQGRAHLAPALPVLRAHGGPGVAAVIALGDRELAFAPVLEEALLALQSDEPTLVRPR